MSRIAIHVAVFVVGAAAGALALRSLPDPRLADLEGRLADLEQDLVAARRDANDYERVALVERQRKEELEEEIRHLRVAVQERPAPEPGERAHGGDPGIPPEQWDDPMLRRQLSRLSMLGRRMFRSPLIDQCAAAARALGDTGYGTLVQVLGTDGLDAGLLRASSMVLEKLGDPRAVNLLTKRWNDTVDAQLRRTYLRALANIPGDDQVPSLLDVWRDGSEDDSLRLVAIHGLALRGHPSAIALAVSPSTPGEAGLRARAISSLHLRAKRAEYSGKDMIPTFATALLTADGEAQRRLALLALEGYWDPACISALRNFADRETELEELRERARSIADAIAAGEPRPDNAGVPRVGEQGGDSE